MEVYVLPVVGLLSMLVRGCPVPLTSDIEQEINVLKANIHNANTILPSIVRLLSLLWQRTWLPTPDLPIPDPTMTYLALSTVRNQQGEGTFLEPHRVTSTISKFEYCFRIFFLSLIHREPTIEEGLQRYQMWITEKIESPFNSLRTYQHLASSIAYATVSPPSVWWLDRVHHRSMLYKGSPVEINQISNVVQRLEERITHVWENEILMSTSLKVKYSMLSDDLSSRDIGYSFVRDHRNQCFRDNTMLAHAVVSNSALRQRFMSQDGSGSFVMNVHELRKWLNSYAHFHLLQLILCHITAGSPSRGTELTAMLICNIPTYPLRNLVVFGHHIALLCTYIKTSNTTGIDKLIPHALGAFQSDLFVQDLAIARPFAKIAARVCHPKRIDVQQRFDTHLFINHTSLFTTNDLTLGLKQASAPFLLEPIGVNDWRHISTAFRRHLCPRLQDLILEDDDETIPAIQMGHNSRTDRRAYGISADSLAGPAEDILPLFLLASTDWQVQLNVVPGGLGLPYSDVGTDAFDALLHANVFSLPPSDAHSGHSRKLILDKIAALEAKIDQLLRLPPSTAYQPDTPDTSVTSPSCTPRSDSLDIELQALQALRFVLSDPMAEWTSDHQKNAVLSVLKCDRDIVAVLPTGSGKTMLALLPSLIEKSQITVVILPLRILLFDYSKKLRTMNVPYHMYFPHIPIPGNHNLVLVSADNAKTPHWRMAIAQLHERVPVVRQVVDEAHIPATHQDYRDALKNMADLRIMFACQSVLISGTANTALVSLMLKEYGLGPDTLVMRTGTNRPELQYEWRAISGQSDMVGIIQKEIATVSDKDRAVIFVPWYKLGQQLSEELHIPFFHGGDDLDSDDRNSMFNDWSCGFRPVILATSAFGTGNDYAHVRLVIHAGNPYELLSFIQEVSRAGRDRQPARCLLLTVPPSDSPPAHPSLMVEDYAGKQAMKNALRQPWRCVRFTLTSYIDGDGLYCSADPKNQLCSVCLTKKQS